MAQFGDMLPTPCKRLPTAAAFASAILVCLGFRYRPMFSGRKAHWESWYK